MLLSGTYAIAGRLLDHITRMQEMEDENKTGEVKFRPVRIEDNLIKEAGLSSIETDIYLRIPAPHPSIYLSGMI
ncbi:hypothetical protein DVH24_007159 [Malus domestica]|uniref:Uncharacterized protein n=1 Tax=Malus domestica TaxID=3750 RepID=A0A498HLU1_MALDO|nr:hypothetical protein DVH24_007159 [Malus domestica]